MKKPNTYAILLASLMCISVISVNKSVAQNMATIDSEDATYQLSGVWKLNPDYITDPLIESFGSIIRSLSVEVYESDSLEIVVPIGENIKYKYRKIGKDRFGVWNTKGSVSEIFHFSFKEEELILEHHRVGKIFLVPVK